MTHIGITPEDELPPLVCLLDYWPYDAEVRDRTWEVVHRTMSTFERVLRRLEPGSRDDIGYYASAMPGDPRLFARSEWNDGLWYWTTIPAMQRLVLEERAGIRAAF